MREVIAAIREGLPEADQLQPGQVFQHVLEALHDCSKNCPKNEQFYLLRLNSRMIPKVDFTTEWRSPCARSQLKWTREGNVWILLYRRRRMGRVVPDKDHSCMWRSVKVDGI